MFPSMAHASGAEPCLAPRPKRSGPRLIQWLVTSCCAIKFSSLRHNFERRTFFLGVIGNVPGSTELVRSFGKDHTSLYVALDDTQWSNFPAACHGCLWCPCNPNPEESSSMYLKPSGMQSLADESVKLSLGKSFIALRWSVDAGSSFLHPSDASVSCCAL